MSEELDEQQELQMPHHSNRPIAVFWRKIGGGSLTIAALIHLAILIVALFWVLRIYHDSKLPIDFLPGGSGGGGGERGAQYKVENKKRAAMTPTNKVKRVVAEGAASAFTIDPGENFGEASPLTSLNGGPSGGLGGSGSGGGFGSGKGKGIGAGTGNGFGGNGIGPNLFGLIPETMRKRCSRDDRLQRLRDNGGTPACEEAVLKSLRWLKSTQATDGSWGSRYKPAMTGLALLAFFGHCETPVSEEFGETTLKGIAYLVDIATKQDGRLSLAMNENYSVYEHAIATYALAEAYTFCKDLKQNVPGLREASLNSGQFIIDNQNTNGGWAYKYDISTGHVDTSTTGWQIQALKACKHTKLEFRGMSNAIQKSLKYLEGNQDAAGGFGYTNTAPAGGAAPYHSLTGVGVLCFQMWDKGSHQAVRKGCKYIKENSKLNYNGAECDLYAHYYESQAMMQKGGEEWQHYNSMFRDQILNNQDAAGSWKPVGGGGAIKATAPQYQGGDPESTHYRTCLCTLMLEVYYRFLNSTGTGARASRLDDI